jgi:SRSO17 transposase
MSAIRTVPMMNVTVEDLKLVVGELKTYHEIYSPFFQRSEQRANAELYLKGLLSPLERKSVERIVLGVEGVDRNAVRSLQCFISQGAWKDEPIVKQHWKEVDRDLGEADGVVTVDGSDFPKQGTESVGVKRQYCGQLGKRANCQAGVFVGYASRKGYTLIDRRLYLPEEWVKDEGYEEKRKKCGIPEEISFKTKQELALEMISGIRQAGTLRCQWVAVDEAFGRDTVFLDEVGKCGLWYFAEVPVDTRVWIERPETAVPEWSGRGRKPVQARLSDGEPKAQTVVAVAESLSAQAWHRRTIKEGSQGPLEAEFAVVRVIAVRDGLPGPEVWLVLRRHLETGELKTYLSNAPAEIPTQTLARLSGCRWPIETCFEDSKQLLGMGDYEVRSWVGWHHHMTLVILAHFFVVRTMLGMKKKVRS